MAQIMRVTVDGVNHEMNLDKLTFGEGRSIEKVTGQSLKSLGGSPDLTMVQALVWVALKRTDTRLAFSDLDDRAIADFELDITDDGDGSEPDPTEGDTSA